MARSGMVSKRASSAATVASALVGGNDSRDACEPTDDGDDDDKEDSGVADGVADDADTNDNGGAWASSICRRRRHADSCAWLSTLAAFVSTL
jgi:hypothetical protein